MKLSVPSFDHHPFDFLKGYDQEKLKNAYLHDIERKLSEDNSLSFETDHDGNKFLVVFEKLQWDTDFFGSNIFKISEILAHDQTTVKPRHYSAIIGIISEKIASLGGGYVFMNLDSRHTYLAQGLGLQGFAWIEGRSVYHRSLKDFNETIRYSTRDAAKADIPSLSEASAKMFNQYDRFHADPFFDPFKVNELMKLWVINSIEKGFADFTTVPAVENPRAFCTVKTHQKDWDRWGVKLSQPVLSAVDSSMRGWYVKIISEICHKLKDLGSEHTFLVTQNSNRAVIRVWEKLGFSFGRADNIFSKVIK